MVVMQLICAARRQKLPKSNHTEEQVCSNTVTLQNAGSGIQKFPHGRTADPTVALQDTLLLIIRENVCVQSTTTTPYSDVIWKMKNFRPQLKAIITNHQNTYKKIPCMHHNNMQVTDISVLQYCVIKAQNTAIKIRYSGYCNMLKTLYSYIKGVKGLSTDEHPPITFFLVPNNCVLSTEPFNKYKIQKVQRGTLLRNYLEIWCNKKSAAPIYLVFHFCYPVDSLAYK